MRLTGWITPQKRPIRLFDRHEQPIREHVHVRPGAKEGALHLLLPLCEDELSNPPLGVHMTAMVFLVKACDRQGVFDVCPDVVLHTFCPGNLVGPEVVEEFVLLSQCKTVHVDPCAVNASEGFMQIMLVVLGALDQGHILKSSKLLGAGRLDVAC